VKDNVLKDKSYQFAIRIVKLSQFLQQEKKEFVLSKQVLRSGTADRKSGILLRGRYQKQAIAVQMIVPLKVIQELLDTVFVVRDYVVLAGVGVAVVAFGIMALVFALSIRLRRREIETIRKIGGARQRLLGVLSAEIVIVVAAGLGLAAGLTAMVSHYGDLLVRIV